MDVDEKSATHSALTQISSRKKMYMVSQFRIWINHDKSSWVRYFSALPDIRFNIYICVCACIYLFRLIYIFHEWDSLKCTYEWLTERKCQLRVTTIHWLKAARHSGACGCCGLGTVAQTGEALMKIEGNWHVLIAPFDSVQLRYGLTGWILWFMADKCR